MTQNLNISKYLNLHCSWLKNDGHQGCRLNINRKKIESLDFCNIDMSSGYLQSCNFIAQLWV